MTEETCPYCEEGELDETCYDGDDFECEMVYRCKECGAIMD